jgi:hypothetical protein
VLALWNGALMKITITNEHSGSPQVFRLILSNEYQEKDREILRFIATPFPHGDDFLSVLEAVIRAARQFR